MPWFRVHNVLARAQAIELVQPFVVSGPAQLDQMQAATIRKLLLITSNPQLDDLFAAVAA